MKIAVYTCVTEGKDLVATQAYQHAAVDYFLFGELNVNGWKTRPLQYGKGSGSIIARWHKTHPHRLFPDHNVSVWLDGNIDIVNCDLHKCVKSWLRFANMALFSHPEGRRCIYDEYEACMRLRKDQPDLMTKQIGQYRKENYPEDNGLAMTGVLARRHNEKDVVMAMDKWWEQIRIFSCRDQLSFNYIAHTLNFRYVEIQEYYLDSMFRNRRHLKR